jgi:hypothetical protein
VPRAQKAKPEAKNKKDEGLAKRRKRRGQNPAIIENASAGLAICTSQRKNILGGSQETRKTTWNRKS